MRPQSNSWLARAGRVSYGLVAALLCLPLPIVIIALLWGGCTNW